MTLVANVGEAAILLCTTFLFVECKTNLFPFFPMVLLQLVFDGVLLAESFARTFRTAWARIKRLSRRQGGRARSCDGERDNEVCGASGALQAVLSAAARSPASPSRTNLYA